MWRRGRALVVLLAGVLAGCGASSAVQGPAEVTAVATCPTAAGSLTGVVTGAPAAGRATIYLWQPAGGPLATLSTRSQHARVSLPLHGVGRVAPGEYDVEAYQSGYTSPRRTVRVTTTALCIRLPLVRNPRSEAAILRVTVASSLRRGATMTQAGDGARLAAAREKRPE